MPSRVILRGSRISQRDELLYTVAAGLAQYKLFAFIVFTAKDFIDSAEDWKIFARVFLLGREEGQLWYPRKVAVIRTSGRYVVCDRGSERSRMQLFTKNGQFIKKIAIRYIDIVAGLAITAQGIRAILH